MVTEDFVVSYPKVKEITESATSKDAFSSFSKMIFARYESVFAKYWRTILYHRMCALALKISHNVEAQSHWFDVAYLKKHADDLKDPFTGKDLIIISNKTMVLLVSPGPDGKVETTPENLDRTTDDIFWKFGVKIK